MDARSTLPRVLTVLGLVAALCSNAAARPVHTYSKDFDLRIPADPDDSRGWMEDAVIDVPDHFTVYDLDVGITLTHTSAFDLQIFVKSPAGTTLLLNAYDLDEFFVGQDYTQTIFDDEAEIPIEEAEPPFTGRFRPKAGSLLQVFDGHDAFGLWRLRIYDQWYADTGYLNNVQLIVTVPELPPALSLLAPNGGELLTAGTTYTVTWSNAGSISDVLVEYSADNGSTWVLVDPPNAGNSGSYHWPVPQVNSSQCLVRVSDATNPSISDTSDAPFTIEHHTVTPPAVTTQSATNVAATTASLRGLIDNDGGQACQHRFRYKKSTGSYTYTSWAGSKTTGQSFSQDITGLSPGSLYYFNAQAKNSAGQSNWANEQLFLTVRPFSGAGSGTEQDPYLITNVDQLQQMNDDLEACYQLDSDIDASATAAWNGGAGFLPIGNSTDRFEGHFDGRGHKIIGLHIKRGSSRYIGLFGHTDSASEIRNVALEQVSVTGNLYVGALIGTNRGSIENSYSTGTVSGYGHSSGQVGGLIGRNYLSDAEISNSYSTATVSAAYKVGGLVGENYRAKITHCYSLGPVSGTGDDVGGLIGANTGTCTACFWNRETSAQAASACGTATTTAQMQTFSTFADAGWDFADTWTICNHTNYPKLLCHVPAWDFLCPDGADLADFAFLAARWLQDNCTESNDHCDRTDLDQSGSVDITDLEIFLANWLAGVR